MAKSWSKLAYGAIALGLIWAGQAQSGTCSPTQAVAADAMIDQLRDWEKVNLAFRKFGNCDDGSIAEGFSDAVVRLLADHWPELPQLAQLIRRNPPLMKFVLRHIDTTVDIGDLQKIRQLSSASCPQGMNTLCKDLGLAATQAAK